MNLSARRFRHPELVEEVSAVLDETGVNPPDPALEIAESVMIEKGHTALGILRSLKDLGVTLMVDDFGTRHFSIANLKNFPVDVLKMDKAMVAGKGGDPKNRAIVSATTGLAQALGLGVVAGGVETVGELDELRSMGCDVGRGYYWQRPRTAGEMGELLVAGLGP